MTHSRLVMVAGSSQETPGFSAHFDAPNLYGWCWKARKEQLLEAVVNAKAEQKHEFIGLLGAF